ncbi:putative leucine-rich repeat-containing protein DDB_G0290503 [Diaphorina citri]|uniref:Leucine-rich repeat-containing protein DDB_G0290503 n=1 Tax=Diaphorina citri TaxID=121845 RepID=A0A1S4ED67_DIACI|nr:putative leucine-rich repeat-containing protein DDB_G0290503 [Diaphorina citri]
MSLRDSVYWVVRPAVLLYWVSHTFAAEAEKQAANNLVDWDYAQLHLVDPVPLQDKLNYHNLCIMRRERQQLDPNRKLSKSQEQYEYREFERLYNAVFSTKPPHLRNSQENYIQHVKDEFFRRQMEPLNPKTSRERYEWHVKKQQGSFFGGKYDFGTYFRGNFTARRRRSVDVEGFPGGGKNSKQKQPPLSLNTENNLVDNIEEMRFEDNVVNIIKGIGDTVNEHGQENLGVLSRDLQEKRGQIVIEGKEPLLIEVKEPVDNIEIAVQGPVVGQETLVESLVNTRNHHLDNALPDERETILKIKKERTDPKLRIRSKRVRREKVNLLINPGSKFNRSWQLDPRNPWNKNIRYKKHLKLFDAFYMDFYSREGSDRLPSNETFIKIKPPAWFRQTRFPYETGQDSRSVSHYMNEIEKIMEKVSRASDITYGVTTKEERRRERDRNHTAILKEEERQWQAQLGRIKYLLKKNNITKAEHDRLLENIEMDKKIKYKLYRTRSTKHVVQKAMEQLQLAANFVASDVYRDKRDVGDAQYDSNHIEDEFVEQSEGNPNKPKIRSKRVRRNIFERHDKLEAKLENVRKVHLSQGAPNYSPKRLVRNKRYFFSTTSTTESSEEKRLFHKDGKGLKDYEPYYRHNMVYEDDTVERTTPTTLKPKKTTVLTEEQLEERKALLKSFEKEYQIGVKLSKKYEMEFNEIHAKAFNKTRTKREILIKTNERFDSMNNGIIELIRKLLEFVKMYQSIIGKEHGDFPSVDVNLNIHVEPNINSISLEEKIEVDSRNLTDRNEKQEDMDDDKRDMKSPKNSTETCDAYLTKAFSLIKHLLNLINRIRDTKITLDANIRFEKPTQPSSDHHNTDTESKRIPSDPIKVKEDLDAETINTHGEPSKECIQETNSSLDKTENLSSHFSNELTDNELQDLAEIFLSNNVLDTKNKVLDNNNNGLDINNNGLDINSKMLDININLLDANNNLLDINKSSPLRRKLRKKRYTLEDLMKGPIKSNPEKTKLEVDASAQDKKEGAKKYEFSGPGNVDNRVYRNENGQVQDFHFVKNQHHSRENPDHPENHRVDMDAYYEEKERRYATEFLAEYDESLGIRERMHQDYLKMVKETKIGFIDRAKLNQMELQRAHKERMEFLRAQPTEAVTEVTTTTEYFEALSSFEEEKGKKPKDRIKEKLEELKELRRGFP